MEVWGTVPQGTLIGVLCFVCMINDLGTECPTVKYVDDTTIYRITNDPNDTVLQSAVDSAISWSKRNNMKINPIKCKELFISFANEPPIVPQIVIDGELLERVSTCKLLRVILNDKLSWGDHVEMVHKKCSQ